MSTPSGYPPPAAGDDVEQEVDFSRYWRLLAIRWWLVVAGLVVGLVIGYAASLGTTRQTWEATASVYLGQPFAPGTTDPVTKDATRVTLADGVIESDAVIRKIAAKAGLKPSHLKDHITLAPHLAGTSTLDVTVDGTAPAKLVVAANEVAKLLVENVSQYTNTRIATLHATLALDLKRLANITKRSDLTQRQIEQLLNVSGLSASEKLISSLNLNNLLQFLEARQSSLESAQLSLNQALSLADIVERARIFVPALATRTPAPSSRTGAAIGGLIGLIVGLLAALLWDRVAARLRARET